MLIEVIPGGAFVENTYLIKGDKSKEIILIDPGSQIIEIEEAIKQISFDKSPNRSPKLISGSFI